MSQVPQHLIDEAAKRGIVPGATIGCAASKTNATGIVAPYSEWKYSSGIGTLWVGTEKHRPSLLAAKDCEDEWATVITPAPSQHPQAIGLQEGDAVECSTAMRAAIIELAKELGLGVWKDTDDYQPPRYCLYWNSREARLAPRYPSVSGTKLHTPEDFIAKMRVTASQPKPITIGGKTVEFTKGEISVGCTTISNETVRAVAAKLID